MNDLWEATRARNTIKDEVVRILGPKSKELGDELARRVEEHAKEFHSSLPVTGLQSAEDYQRHLHAIRDAGFKAILASVNSALKLMGSVIEVARRDGE